MEKSNLYSFGKISQKDIGPKALFLVFIRLCRQHPVYSFIFLLGTILVGLVQVVSIGTIFPILSVITGAGTDNVVIDFFNKILAFFNQPHELTNYIVLFVCMGFASFVIYLCVEVFQARFVRYVEYQEAEKLFNHVVRAKWLKLSKLSHGDFITFFKTDIEQMVKVIKFNFQLLSGLIQIVFLGASIIYLSWQLFLCGLLLSAIHFIFFFPLLKITSRIGLESSKSHVQVNESLINVSRSFKNIKAATLETKISTYIIPILKNMANVYYKQNILVSFQTKFSEFLGIVILSILLFTGLKIFSINVAVLTAILVIYSRMIPKLRSFIDDYHRAISHLPAVLRINKIAEYCTDVDKKERSEIDCVEVIEFKNVGFYYEKNQPIVTDLNLKMLKGERWAICGESGVGKTTILDLIIGILEPVDGKILFNEKDQSNISRKSLHKCIGYLTQHSFIFSGTLRQNILWGNDSDITEKDLEKAIEIAQLKEFVSENGFDFLISESGQNLSGGQKQRIAIARMLLGHYDFILLDEPTSALDPGTEKRLIKSLLANQKETGVIIVTHREEYLKYVDNIINVDTLNISISKNYKKDKMCI